MVGSLPAGRRDVPRESSRTPRRVSAARAPGACAALPRVAHGQRHAFPPIPAPGVLRPLAGPEGAPSRYAVEPPLPRPCEPLRAHVRTARPPRDDVGHALPPRHGFDPAPPLRDELAHVLPLQSAIPRRPP